MQRAYEVIESPYIAPPELRRIQQRALIVGAVLLVLLLIGAFVDRAQFFHSYLVGIVFWAGLSLGALALLMLQHLTGGNWGLVIRRVLEAATRTIPLILILFVPIVLGMKHIYPWTHAEEMSKNRSEEHTSELQSPCNLVCRLLLEKKK